MATAVSFFRKKKTFGSSRLRLGLVLFFLLLIFCFYFFFRSGEKPITQATGKQLAIQYLNKGKFDEAAGELQRIISVNPKDTDSMMKLAYCYQRLGEPGKSVDRLKEAARIEPKSDQVQYALGLMEGSVGNRRAQIAALKKAVQFNKSWPAPRSSLADALFATGRIREAAAHYKILYQQTREKGVLFRLNQCYERRGKK